MFKNRKRKKKERITSKGYFVKRGMYFVANGENKGCFLLYMQELSNDSIKVLSQYPEGIKVEMTNDEVKLAFEKCYFEFVETLPPAVYKVCLGQHTKEKSE